MQFDLTFPPGYASHGTNRQSRGRWRGGNLVRFYEDDIRPIGGWFRLSDTPMLGRGRAITTWADNDGSTWAGIGTHSRLYAMTKGGRVQDITPTDYTTGRAIAVNGGGYGEGQYGVGTYGVPIASDTTILPATTWSLHVWGENLIGVANHDGRIYEWVPTPAFDPAEIIANSPTCTSALVTNERILMALGADSDPRLIRWSDSENNTDWTPTASNRAGDLRVPTEGRIITGVTYPGGVLVFTEADVWLAEYLGAAGYGIREVAGGAGAISPGAVVRLDNRIVWMGPEGFWSYAGLPQPIACDVYEDVFENINRAQLSLVTSFHNSSFGEVWWFYPSDGSLENDSYVAWSYREGHWVTGQLPRLSAVDVAPYRYPLMVGADGYVYAHETGDKRDGLTSHLVSGPFTLGRDLVMVDAYIPDGRTLGDTVLTLTTRLFPHGDETTTGPFPAAAKTDFRVTGREVDMRFDFTPDTDWRVGVPMLRGKKRGGR